MTLESDLLRHALRTWTTGVAILLTSHAGETYGMTINSFTSLSVDPPLVSAALQTTTHLCELVTNSGVFSVTILSANQQELAENFAGKLHGPERMAGVKTQTLVTGAPVLTGGLACLDCRVIQTLVTGTNTLFIAEVAEARVQSTESPLVYHNRGYCQITLSS